MKTDYSLLEAALIGYQHQRELLAAKIAEIQRQLGDAHASPSAESPKKRVMNAAARKRIAQAQRKRWAEFLTVISTAALIPLEVYELFHRPTFTRGFLLLVNIAVVAYLVFEILRVTRAKHAEQDAG